MVREALYYPYIGIRRIEWLKANLLMFRCVRRMTPYNFEVVPGDDEVVKSFITAGLLQPADLMGATCQQLQLELANELARDGQSSSFLRRYGPDAARKLRSPNNPFGFQMSAGKMRRELVDALCDTMLAWNPEVPEPRYADYLELHPNVGQAVMSTLAIGCAQDEGFDIVGDERSGALHRCLVEQDAQNVYAAWLHKGMSPLTTALGGRDVFEYMIAFECDSSKLSCEDLATMPDEIRVQVADFVKQLGADLGDPLTIRNRGRRDKALHEVVSSARQKWEKSRNTWGNFWRTFFGADVVDPGEKFVEKLRDKVGELRKEVPVAVAPVGIAAWVGHAVNPLMTVPLSAGVAITTYGIKTALKRRDTAKTSPYRFLTSAERMGIVFRSQVPAP